MVGSYFLYDWLIIWQNALYLYLNRSKLGLMYQEICCSNISSGIIKGMKFDPRNKWRKIVTLKLNTSCYRRLMKKLDTSSIYRELRFQNSQFWNSVLYTLHFVPLMTQALVPQWCSNFEAQGEFKAQSDIKFTWWVLKWKI